MKLQTYMEQAKERADKDSILGWTPAKEYGAREAWKRSCPLRRVTVRGVAGNYMNAREKSMLECGHYGYGTPNAERMRCFECGEAS